MYLSAVRPQNLHACTGLKRGTESGRESKARQNPGKKLRRKPFFGNERVRSRAEKDIWKVEKDRVGKARGTEKSSIASRLTIQHAKMGEEEEEEEDAYVRELISFVLDREPKKAGPLIEARLKLK
mmetsp:Transcript_46685/g.92175  ORF Transcript_46685/g.92175 Transcript_46685/m.92175 type:complete len:125 (-) Transcript_46685:248-622(-)